MTLLGLMFEFLLGYPLTTYQQADWAFNSNWPIWLFYTLLVVFAASISWFLIRARRSLSPIKLVSLGGLQFVMLALVLLMLWQPVLVIERLKLDQNSVAIMLDSSRSMDYGERESRIDTARGLLDYDGLAEVQTTFSTDKYFFSDNSLKVDDFDSLPEPGQVTRLANSLVEVLEAAKTKSVAALILISDGAETGAALSSEQLAEISSYGVPIHTLGVGREQIAEDIELESLSVPDRVLPNTLVSAMINIRHDSSGLARLKVYNGDEYITSEEVELVGELGSTQVQLEFEAGEPGFHELSFELDPFEQSDGLVERNLENNLRNHLLEVADQDFSVLYLEGEPRYEYKYLRRALIDDPTIDLVTLLWVSDNKFYRQGISNPSELEFGFPADKDSLFRYDAIIIGSLEAPRLSSEQQQMLYEFVSERGGSLLMLGGRNGLAEGGWGNTPIADLLPVRIKGLENSYIKERVQARLSPLGADSAFLALAENSGDNAQRWAQLPPLDSYQHTGTLRPAATVHLNVTANGDQLPLLIAQPYGKGQSYVLATGGTWRWQMGLPADDDSHETFWRQLLRALVTTSPETMSFTVEQMNDELRLTAEVRDPSHQPIDDVRVLALLSSENTGSDVGGTGLELTRVPDIPGRYEARIRTDNSGGQNSLGQAMTGTWYIDAIASQGEQPLDAARVAVHLSGEESESFGIRQDRAQLERISQATQGQYWTADSIDGLMQAIEFSDAGITEEARYPLWSVPLVFILLLIIKLTEWLLRRHWGHI